MRVAIIDAELIGRINENNSQLIKCKECSFFKVREGVSDKFLVEKSDGICMLRHMYSMPKLRNLNDLEQKIDLDMFSTIQYINVTYDDFCSLAKERND